MNDRNRPARRSNRDDEIVPVCYVGGPLNGTVNELDYTRGELREQEADGQAWDYTPASIDPDADDVIERYRPHHQDGQWSFVHAGTLERPVAERNVTAVFAGGPRDGQRTTFTGTIRRHPERAAWLCPGYVLRHHGADPLDGWVLHHEPDPDGPRTPQDTR